MPSPKRSTVPIVAAAQEAAGVVATLEEAFIDPRLADPVFLKAALKSLRVQARDIQSKALSTEVNVAIAPLLHRPDDSGKVVTYLLIRRIVKKGVIGLTVDIRYGRVAKTPATETPATETPATV